MDIETLLGVKIVFTPSWCHKYCLLFQKVILDILRGPFGGLNDNYYLKNNNSTYRSNRLYLNLQHFYEDFTFTVSDLPFFFTFKSNRTKLLLDKKMLSQSQKGQLFMISIIYLGTSLQCTTTLIEDMNQKLTKKIHDIVLLYCIYQMRSCI